MMQCKHGSELPLYHDVSIPNYVCIREHQQLQLHRIVPHPQLDDLSAYRNPESLLVDIM